MNSMSSTQAANIDCLRDQVVAAERRGLDEREARATRAADEYAEQLVEHQLRAPERARAILADLPAWVQEAIVNAKETPVNFLVMWLERHEYDGPIADARVRGYRVHEVQPARLRLAGDLVFQALVEARLFPRLQYAYRQPAVGETSVHYENLGIWLTVGGGRGA